MAWTLKITPQGILYNQYYKNYSIYNSSSTQLVETSHFLSDYFSTNLQNNTVDLRLSIDIYDNNPLNTNPTPFVVGISEISISNDPNFQQVAVIVPDIFDKYYDKSTNYSFDLSNLNIGTLTLPTISNIKFIESDGLGTIILKNWPLSDGAGKKRVFYKIVVELSDGSLINYPFNYGVYDEVIVFTNDVTPPDKPNVLSQIQKNNINYSLVPAVFSAFESSNSFSQDDDSGVASYFWDCLVLKSLSNIYINNPTNNFLLFDNVTSSNSNNVDGYSNTFTLNGSNILFSGVIPPLTSSSNVSFLECRFNNQNIVYGNTDNTGFKYQFELRNTADSSYYVKIELNVSNKLNLTTIVITLDSGNTVTFNYTNYNVIGQMSLGGSFLLLTECFDVINGLFQCKLIYANQFTDRKNILCEYIFYSSSLSSNSFKYKFTPIWSSTNSSKLTLEASQYGYCYGTISASILPVDKFNQAISPFFYSNSFPSANLSTWITLSNSPYAAAVGYSTSDQFYSFYNQSSVYNNLEYVVSEIQSQIPTFNENSGLNIEVQTNNLTSSSLFRLGYSFDDNLNFNNYSFVYDLFNSDGLKLPKASYLYTIQNILQWNDSSKFILNLNEQNTNETSNISNPITTDLILFDNTSYSQIIKTKQGLSSSNAFSSWITLNGYSSSSILCQSLVFTNEGNFPITINTSSISTVSPNQTFVFTSLATQQSQASSLQVLGQLNQITKSINFLFDYGSAINLNSAKFKIKIADPPNSPSNLPSFQYSVESSTDFITFNYLSGVTLQANFSASTGKITLSFSNFSLKCRYLRIRLYYNANASFDPRQNYIYSDFESSYSNNFSDTISGKIIFGFTDTSSKYAGLNALYNQPTYLRTLQTQSTHNSRIYGIVLDYTDYVSSSAGPVYLSLLTDSGEKRIKVFESSFPKQYQSNFSLQRGSVISGYKLQGFFNISTSSSVFYSTSLEELMYEPQDKNKVDFGYYPFVSLAGNGAFKLLKANTEAYDFINNNNTELSYKTYFSLFTANDPNDTPNFGKNLIYQNSYNPAALTTWPHINNYFSNYSSTVFDSNNVTVVVKVVTTSSIVLYGSLLVDGIYVTAGDLVLVAGQVDKTQNGVYEVSDYQWNQIYLSSTQPLIKISDGVIFNQTLWAYDIVNNEWLSNVVQTSFAVTDNSLLNGNTIFKLPNFIKLAINAVNFPNISDNNQVKIKLVNSNSSIIATSDLATTWQSLIEPSKFNSLQEKGPSNAQQFLGFYFTPAQISAINRNNYPTIVNLLVSFEGNYIPVYSNNTQVLIPDYGTSYRIIRVPQLIIQAFSSLATLSYNTLNNNNPIQNMPTQTAVYGMNIVNNKSPQSSFSDYVLLTNTPPTLGILRVVQDNIKNVVLGLSTYPQSSTGTLAARVIQTNPINETIYGSWFGYQSANGFGLSSSLVGLSTIVAFPSAIQGLQTSYLEPLSGYYRYKIQVLDVLGNWSETNEVTNFYYENTIVDTQPPIANVSFVKSDYSTPLQVASSNIVNAQLNAFDYVTGVKAYQYTLGTSGVWSNWIDYNNYVNIYLDNNLADGNLTVQFRFKDYANNIMTQSSTAVTYTIVSRLLSNVVFTVMATLGNNLFVGGSRNGAAALYLWSNNFFTFINNSYLVNSTSVSAIKALSNGIIVVGTDKGYIFLYENNILTGPITQISWSGSSLPISKIHEHLFEGDPATTVLVGTLNLPRIFYISLTQIYSSTWNVLQPQNPYISSLSLSNTGLWSGNQFYYSLSTSYIPVQLSIIKNYGISSGILINPGSQYNFNNNATTVQAVGPISNFYGTVIGQGGITIAPLNGYIGAGYTSGTTIVIDPPSPGIGTSQAVFTPVIGANGSITNYVGSPGSGYTQIPSVRIVGVGTGAIPNVQVNYSSVWGINVVSPGVATTTQISLNIIGSGVNATVNPDFLYRINNVSITSSGFGYISNPIVSVNGITTLISPVVKYGSIQSIGFNSNFTFPVSAPLTYSLSGGIATDFNVSISTTSTQFYSNGVLNTGTIISSIILLNSGNNISNYPSISFSSSLFDPEITFNLSDDILFNSSKGSIYDIDSYFSSIYVSNSEGSFVNVTKDLTTQNFTVTKHDLNIPLSGKKQIPYSLVNYQNKLYFSIYNSALIGYVYSENSYRVFNDIEYNTLLFKPINMDILADWQLVKNVSDPATGSASAGIGINTYSGLLELKSFNSQIYYDSTKTSIWLNRLNSFNEITSGKSVNFAVSLFFVANYGTQSVEISTYYCSLKINFIISNDGTKITCYVGPNNTTIYTAGTVTNDLSGMVFEFVKNGSSLNVYVSSSSAQISLATLANFFIDSIAVNSPIFRFGEIFKVLNVTTNNNATQVFGVPPTTDTSPIFNSDFYWKQIKFAFQNSIIPPASFSQNNYEIPYNLNISQPIQFLSNLNNQLFGVVKGCPYFNSNTIVNDNSVKIFSLSTSSNVFDDVTGNFEIYSAGLSSSYILSSAFDMASIGTSYFITGVTENVNLNPAASPYILLGLSTNIAYEEEDTYITVLYPNQINKNGTILSVACNNNLISVPSTLFFNSTNLTQVISLGIGSTNSATTATISVTDGSVIGLATLNILPLMLNALSISTASFITYSNSLIFLNLGLPKRTISPRTITVTSSMSSVLYASNGLATIYPQTNNTQLLLSMGVATANSGTITFTANYRNSLSTSITVNTLLLSASLSTNIFVAGAVDNSVYVTAGVQTPVWTSLNVSAIPTIAGIFTSTNYQLIIGAGNSRVTTLLTQVGFATTSKVGVYNLSVPGSSIGLGYTALPFTFNTAIDNLNPVFPYQTPTITYTLNNIPYTNLNIYNYIQQPAGVAVTYTPFVTFATGEILQTFSISTTINSGSGIAITVRGGLS